MIRPLIFLLVPALNLFAQNTGEQVRPPMPDTLFLRVQIPAQDTVRTPLSHLRFAACTRPEASAFVNDVPTKVYASGAFVGRADLNVGVNKLRFTVKLNRENSGGAMDSLSKELVIIRPEPMKNSPHDTLVIEEALMKPSQEMWLGAGDELQVQFKGSPGWEAYFDIPRVESGIPMHELSQKEGQGFLGIYAGSYRVKPTDYAQDVQIVFHLKKSFWSSEKAVSKTRISIIPKDLPRVAELIGDRPYLNAGLGTDRLGASKLGFLQPGVRVEVTGKTGSLYRVRLSEVMEAWLPEEYAKLLPPSTEVPRSLAGAITETGNGTYDLITLALSDKLAYSSEQSVDPPALAVDIYGATSNTNWILHNQSAKGIERVTWTQVASDQYRMLITLRHPHWGYDIDYVGSLLRIRMRRPPAIASDDSVLRGMLIAVDAGHGGDSKGAVGATGALERDINIFIARHLEDILRAQGAKVLMTRSEEDAPSTSDRAELLSHSGAQVLVSIHCNSTGDAADPLGARGVSTYYRPIGFKPLADIMFDKMVDIGLKQFGVVGSFNFLLNSLTQMPNVLVETAFLSHPEDEMLLLDDGFREKIAKQLASGLEEYVKNFSNSSGSGE